MNVLLANPGVQHTYHLARQLERLGVLGTLHTLYAVRDGSPGYRWAQTAPLPPRLRRTLENRAIAGVPADKIHCYPWLDLWSGLRQTLGAEAVMVHGARNLAFQRRIPDRLLEEADLIVGTDTASNLLAEKARRLGKPFILSRAIGHPRVFEALAGGLGEAYPEWFDRYVEKPEHVLEAEDLEHRLAGLVVVPSRFVARTLIDRGVDGEKIKVNPFGVDVRRFGRQRRRGEAHGGLVFLFVGAVSARKGVPLLIDAWQALRPAHGAELWIAGPGAVPPGVRARALDSIHWLGPVKRSDLPALFGAADVFVFPSYFEGLAKVLLEARASGLPVVATHASGAEEVIEDGDTGFLIESGSRDQLADRIQRFLDHPGLAGEMAARVARDGRDLSWDAYGDRWGQLLTEVCA